MEKYFYEVAINSFSNRNHIIPEEQYNSFIAKYSAAKTEFYHSVFKYTEEIKKHFDTHKTIRNYSGKFKLDFIYFDIDKAKNTDEFTLSRTKYFLKELVDDWQLYWENILIWFSGTGYHIQIHNYFGDDIEDRAVLKQTMSKYFGSTDMAIYGSSSLIRAPYSINYKSGLFKVPFEYEEFMGYNVKDIHEIASTNNVRKINKIVKNEEEGLWRARNIAAIRNNIRLNKKNPCVITGKCEDCQSEERICNILTVLWKKPKIGEITVLLLNEELGY